jgi:hypothetical protein
MPMPTDDKIVAKAQDVLAEFKTVFGKHPGYRPGKLIRLPQRKNL